MKCRLCGQPAVGPDKLCGDCTKALRRAREGSAALRKPETSNAGRVESAAAPVAPRPLTLTSAPPPGWRRRVAWAAAGLVAIGIVYIAQREPDRRSATDEVVSADDRSSKPSAERPDVDVVPGATPPETLPSTTRVKTVDIAAQSVASEATGARRAAPKTELPAVKQASVRAKAGASGAKAPANLEPGSPSSQYARAIDAAPANPVTPESAESSRLLARAGNLQSATATATDGAQVLASALEKCGAEKFLASFLCEQKARLQFCEGKWGQVPQCTAKQRAD